MRVIIPSKDARNLTACVAAIRKSDPWMDPADIIVVDDGARAGAAELPVTWVDGVKPFVYARNVNRGIQAAGRDNVIVMGDDALVTAGNLDALKREGLLGVLGGCSAAVIGTVCNPNQRPMICQCPEEDRPHVHAGVRPEREMLAFVCVFLHRAALDQVGPLDERFVGYGFDDNDYCRRLVSAGWRLGVTDSCVVEHGSLPSSFRTEPGWIKAMAENRERFVDKYEGACRAASRA